MGFSSDAADGRSRIETRSWAWPCRQPRTEHIKTLRGLRGNEEAQRSRTRVHDDRAGEKLRGKINRVGFSLGWVGRSVIRAYRLIEGFCGKYGALGIKLFDGYGNRTLTRCRALGGIRLCPGTDAKRVLASGHKVRRGPILVQRYAEILSTLKPTTQLQITDPRLREKTVAPSGRNLGHRRNRRRGSPWGCCRNEMRVL